MAKRKAKTTSKLGEGTKRGPGRPPGSGTGKYKRSKSKRGRPAKSTGTTTDLTKRGPGRPPKSKRGPGRPPKSTRGPGRPPKSTRGPGRPPKSTRGPGRPPKSTRGPGRPPKTQTMEGVRLTDKDLGKLLDLQTMILDVQRTHYKKSGKFDLSLTKQFSDNFKTVDKIVDIISRKSR